MTTETQAFIQAAAAIESAGNPIDELAILDREIKAMTERAKALKDDLANKLGEGKFRGERYGVRITLEARKGSVDMKALCARFGITDADLDACRGESLAIIKVASIA